MNKMRVFAAILALSMVFSACGAKKDDAVTQPAPTNTVADTTVPETEYEVPDVPGLDRNAFSEDEFEEMQKQTEPEETKAEDSADPEETEEAPAATENIVFEEGTSQESGTGAKVDTEYQRYMAMSGTDQKAFIESFESMEAFFEWLDEAKAYDESVNGAIIVEGDTIDLGKIQ